MDTFHLIPVGSMYAFPADQSAGFVDILGNLPQTIKNLLSSENTAAYITGLGKSHKITPEKQPTIAFVILKIAIGKVAMADFTMTLSSELGIDIDEAQKMATEIYRDLFAPIQDDLDAFIAKKNQPQTPSVDSSVSAKPINSQPKPLNKPSSQAPHVLNLKELSGRPEEKELPAPKPATPRITPTTPRIVDLKNPPTTPQVPPPPPPVPPTPKKTFPLPPVSR